jgi:hypothetical protein
LVESELFHVTISRSVSRWAAIGVAFSRLL